MFHGIDAWLWRRGIDHPAVRVLLRNEILLTALTLLGGGLLFSVTPWVFWFGVGLAVMAWTFWCLARFFLRRGLGDYSTAFLRIVIVRWLGRLVVMAVVLYAALVHWAAPPLALLGGMAAACACALISYSMAARGQGRTD